MMLSTEQSDAADELKKQINEAGPLVAATAVERSSAETKAAVTKLAIEAFPAKDRKLLYLTLMWILAGLAAAGIAGGAVALINKVDSAAFFTFAGIALGGLTALFATSPTSK